MRHFSLFILVSALAVSLPAAAAEWFRPDLAYSATRTLRVFGQELIGPLYYDHGMERFEVTVKGKRHIYILRPDLGLSFRIFPDQGRGQQRSFEDGFGLPTLRAEDEERLTAVGTEMRQGEEAAKYRLDDPSGTGWIWLTSDGIPLRLLSEADELEFDIFLTDVQRGPQPAHLFEVPDGIDFTKSGGK
jgi:hypothetical protein